MPAAVATSLRDVSRAEVLQKETKIAKKLQSWTFSFVSFVAFCEPFASVDKSRSKSEIGNFYDPE
jgi:hypothetical protein